MEAGNFSSMKFVSRQSGFTLAELLIALLILGEIATFTIPKVLNAQQKQNYNAAAKEVASIVAAGFTAAYMENGGESWVANATAASSVPWSTGLSTFVPNRLNYVKKLTSGEVMTFPPGTPGILSYGGWNTCGSSQAAWYSYVECFQLHNGGVLWYIDVPFSWDGQWMQDFFFDPDGTGSAQSVGYRLYVSSRSKNYDDPSGRIMPGRMVTFAQSAAHGNSADPSWFSW